MLRAIGLAADLHLLNNLEMTDSSSQDCEDSAIKLGRILLIAAFASILLADIIVDIFWFSKFGFKASKLGSEFWTVVLFILAYRGAGWARWLTVGFCLLAIEIAFDWKDFYKHALGITLFLQTTAAAVMLSMPAVGAYQKNRRRNWWERKAI